MEVTVSNKYQLVVPKEARKKLGLKPGQKVRISRVGDNTITFDTKTGVDAVIEYIYY